MSNITVGNEKNILFYSDENGQTKVEVILQNENVWLNVNAIATLFDVQRPAIVKHINNIYNDEELSEESTCSVLEQVQIEGTRSVKRQKIFMQLFKINFITLLQEILLLKLFIIELIVKKRIWD